MMSRLTRSCETTLIFDSFMVNLNSNIWPLECSQELGMYPKSDSVVSDHMSNHIFWVHL